MPVRAAGSIRRRFLLVVLSGAVLPLALAGSWLARSSVRSAEGLLRMQLDTSLTTIAANMERRWDYRRGDLLMLAGNEVTLRMMRPAASAASAADSAYLRHIYAAVSTAVPWLRFRASDGGVRWQFGLTDRRVADIARDDVARTRVPVVAPDARVPVTIEIRGEHDPSLGAIDAEVRLSAILPVDSIPILLNGAQLTVADARTGRAFVFPGLGDAPNSVSQYDVNGEHWVAQHRTVAGSLLVLTAAAPTRAYVAPFEQSARIGLVVLLAVVVASLTLAVFFTARITRSLERLAGAADAVANGDLSRHVDAAGEDEVGRLARSFNTMTDSLRRTLQQLSQREALAAVGEFATSLSHEVRNGLTAVRVDLERVEESGPAALEAPALIARSLRNVHRLNGTVTGALAVARSGSMKSHVVDLQAVLKAAVASAESAFAITGSRLVMPGDDAPAVHVRGDAVSLEQLFLNLLLNAGQAMSQGGVAHLDVASDRTHCTVSLCDSGPGMSDAALASLAQPFASSKRGGSGLGLSIARRIAEGHGGGIALANLPGSGLMVTVRLPIDAP